MAGAYYSSATMTYNWNNFGGIYQQINISAFHMSLSDENKTRLNTAPGKAATIICFVFLIFEAKVTMALACESNL